MSTPDSTIPTLKYQPSDRTMFYFCVSIILFMIVYIAVILWGTFLRNYVSAEMQEQTGLTLTFYLLFVEILCAREGIPLIYLALKNIHYEMRIAPREREERMRQFDRQLEEERMQMVAEMIAKQRRKKKPQPIGTPINLKEWINQPSYWDGGYVYILKDIEISGYYKIGKTRTPPTRMKAFGVQLPFAVELIHVIQCQNADVAEKRLHDQFADKRKSGEWFALSDEDITGLKFIHEMVKPPEFSANGHSRIEVE